MMLSVEPIPIQECVRIMKCRVFLGTGLLAFTPAGKMEEFFRDFFSAHAKPVDAVTAEERFGVRIMGPPLDLK